MSKIKLAQIVSGVQGKIGGLVFSNCRNTHKIATKSSNRNRNTLKQNSQRVLFSTISQNWQGLSSAEKKLWNINAPLNRSGYSYFLELNYNLSFCGLNFISIPPKLSGGFQFLDLSVSILYTSNNLYINFLPVVPVGYKLMIFATCPHSNGIVNVKNLFRFIFCLDNGFASPYDCVNEYISVFGSIGFEGQKIVFRFISINTDTGFQMPPIDKIVGPGALPFIYGYDYVTGGAYHALANRILLFPVVAPATGTLNDYNAYARNRLGVAGHRGKCALYDATFNLVNNSVSDEFLFPRVVAWLHTPISGAKPVITNGVLYYMAIWGSLDRDIITVGFDAAAGLNYFYPALYTGIFPNSLVGLFSIGHYLPSFYSNCN